MATRKLMKSRKYATPFAKLHAVSLLSQKDRIRKFAHAIGNAVADGDYVIELGAGSGILSLLAAQAGAEKVTAIEINSSSIAYARQAARENNLNKTIEFVTSHYLEFKPEQKADVVICEMLSSMLLVEQQVTASFHAVSSFLREEGTIMPRRARVYAVPVACHSILERFKWNGLVFPRVPQTVGPDQFTPLSETKLLAEFDFSKQTIPEKVDKTLGFQIRQEGVLTGVVGYFEVDLDDEITISMEDGWRHLFLPLENAIHVQEGDSKRIRIAYLPGQLDSLAIQLR